MRFDTVYYMLPMLTIFTNKFLSHGGTSYGVVNLIKPKHEHDELLYQHERIHTKQFYRTLFTHGIWYNLSKTYAAKSEAEAYKYGSKLSNEMNCKYLQDKYDFGFSDKKLMEIIKQV